MIGTRITGTKVSEGGRLHLTINDETRALCGRDVAEGYALTITQLDGYGRNGYSRFEGDDLRKRSDVCRKCSEGSGITTFITAAEWSLKARDMAITRDRHAIARAAKELDQLNDLDAARTTQRRGSLEVTLKATSRHLESLIEGRPAYVAAADAAREGIVEASLIVYPFVSKEVDHELR